MFTFQWHASNSEYARRHAVAFLRQWLDQHGDGVREVLLVGHSYGGQVAALASDHRLVKRVVTLAAPFVTTAKLGDPYIASVAAALFTRIYLLPALLWLAYIIHGLATRGIHGLMAENAPLDGYLRYAGIGLFAACVVYVVVKLVRLAKRNTPLTQLPDPATSATSVTCVQVNGDAVVEQLCRGAHSEFTQVEPAEGFLLQEALRQPGFKTWGLPYLVLCLLFAGLVTVFHAAFSLTAALYAHRDNYTMVAGQGAFVFILYYFGIALLARWFAGPRRIRTLLTSLSEMVDWEALSLDNRRMVVFRLAGLAASERFVHAVSIADTFANVPVLRMELPARCFFPGLRKHSDIVSDPSVTRQVMAALFPAPTPAPAPVP